MKEVPRPIEILDPKLAEELASKKAQRLNEQMTLDELDAYPRIGQVPPRLLTADNTVTKVQATIIKELAVK